MDKDLTKYYIRDVLLWISLIFFIIFITDLSQEYEIVKHILVIVSLFLILYRTFSVFNISRLKVIIVWIGAVTYLYKNSFTKTIYEKYFGLMLFLNIFVLCIPSFYNKNYHLGLLLLLLFLLTPIYYGKYDENRLEQYNILYLYILILFLIYDDSIRHISLLVLLSIVPMLINYNNTPFLYRIVALLIMFCLYTNKYGLFYSQFRCSNIFIIPIKKISNHHLADLVFKNNDWRTSKFYQIFIMIGYILIYKTFIFMKKNNIKTFIT